MTEFNMKHNFDIKKTKIGFIGAGNMARAIGLQLIQRGLVLPVQLIVSAPTSNNFQEWKSAGVSVTNNNNEVIENCQIIFLAVKPQYLEVAIDSLSAFAGSINEEKIIVSILAGIHSSVIKSTFIKSLGERAVDYLAFTRVMPNMPFLIGHGCSVCENYETGDEISFRIVKNLMETGGICEMIPENLINAVSAVSGSGPAYAYLIIEALSDGAVKMGVPRALAQKLAAQTLLGASKMVLVSDKHPGLLKDEVCSPGGTTIVGIHALEQAGVRAGLINAVEAATRKADSFNKKT